MTDAMSFLALGCCAASCLAVYCGWVVGAVLLWMLGLGLFSLPRVVVWIGAF
jgi:hypothetical protein